MPRRLVRVEQGTPHTQTCPRCCSGYALAYPLLRITGDGVATEPVELVACRSCGLLGKAPRAS